MSVLKDFASAFGVYLESSLFPYAVEQRRKLEDARRVCSEAGLSKDETERMLDEAFIESQGLPDDWNTVLLRKVKAYIRSGRSL